MTHRTLWLALAVTLVGCVESGQRIGDETRLNYQPPAPYAGPPLKVAIRKFADKSPNDKRYIDLGDVGADVLSNELARSGAITVLSRDADITRAAYEEGALGSSQAPRGINDPVPGPQPAAADLILQGIITTFDIRQRRQAAIIYASRTQEVECKIIIELIDPVTLAKVGAEYGTGVMELKSQGVLGVGEASSFDRSMYEEAMRTAIYDCWTRLMRRLEAIRPAAAPR
jgi:curli biogenesis system outer membrane secretion channel CsgG